MKPAQLSISIDVTTNNEYPFALHPYFNTPVAWLNVPSGSIIGTNTPVVEIRPVAESTMREAENALHFSRTDSFGAEYFGFPETLLSPAFRCIVDKTVKSPFPPKSVSFSAYIDRTREPVVDGGRPDVCLASFVRIPNLNYSRWQCLE